MKEVSKFLPDAQGDIGIREVSSIPKGAKEVTPENGQHILAHSETGHHHRVGADGVRRFVHTDPMICYLSIEGEVPVALEHLRPITGHEAFALRPGKTYEIRRQRERTPEGWRVVND